MNSFDPERSLWPPLAKFALGMVIIFGIPRLSRYVRLPAVVGLLLSGVVVGPHVLGIFGEQRPIAEFFADLVKLLLMFVAGKGIAAEMAGRAFKYTPAARLTMWSLTLPQVAATLAATLVAFKTFDPVDQRLIDRRMLDVVLVLMLSTATLGPVLTQQFAPRMLEDPAAMEALNGRVP